MNELELKATKKKQRINGAVEAARQEKKREAGLSRLAADVKDPSRLTFTEIEEVRK